MGLYFIAITTPPYIDRKVLEWKQYMQVNFGCQAALKSPAHITLIPPFTMDGKAETGIRSLLSQCAGEQAQFPVTLHNFSAFPPRVIFVAVLPSLPLGNLQKQLETSFIAHGYPVKPSNRVFHPHVTIANRDLRKDDFEAAFSAFSSLQFHESFTAEDVSLLAHQGGCWKTVFSAPLQPANEA